MIVAAVPGTTSSYMRRISGGGIGPENCEAVTATCLLLTVACPAGIGAGTGAAAGLTAGVFACFGWRCLLMCPSLRCAVQ